jgi:hypothetical protein
VKTNKVYAENLNTEISLREEKFNKLNKNYFYVDPRLIVLNDKILENENGEPISLPFVFYWNSDINRRTYIDIIFSPYPHKNYNNPEYYNKFKGFEMDSVELTNISNKEEILKTFKDFLLFICGNNPICSDYLEQYIAHIVQYPGIKPGVGVLLQGAQGMGKGTLFRLLESLFGIYVAEINDIEQIFGKFTSMISAKLVIFIDEAEGSKIWSKDGPIKTHITEKTVKIEQKGVDAYNEDSFGRYFFATNEENSIKIAPGERRMFVIGNNCPLIVDEDNFNINDIIENQQYTKVLFEYLKTRPIKYKSMNDWQRNRPITDLYNDLRENTIEYCAKFINELVNEHVLIQTNKKIDSPGHVEDYTIKMDIDTLFQIYQSKTQENKKFELTKSAFSKKLQKYGDNGAGGITGVREWDKISQQAKRFIIIDCKALIKTLKRKKLYINN